MRALSEGTVPKKGWERGEERGKLLLLRTPTSNAEREEDTIKFFLFASGKDLLGSFFLSPPQLALLLLRLLQHRERHSAKAAVPCPACSCLGGPR